jgi:hypothetical protein
MNSQARWSLLVFTTLILAQGGRAFAQWRPADSPLTTEWAADLNPENAWREYPRPQMVRTQWTNLNGLWDYAIVARDAERPESWEGKILVPFAVESSLSGVKKPVSPEQRLWYRRMFARPELADGGHALLHFGAVDWQCTVWVNGQQVGEHSGGFDPFTLDVTNALRDGENELVVAVWDPTDSSYQPRGKQVLRPQGIWYTAVTGIWQTVWLEPTPHEQIESLTITPDVDRSLAAVTVKANGGSSVKLTASLAGREVASATGNVGQPVELKVPNPQWWSPDAPNLYDLKVELQSANNAAVDSLDSYFGLRKIEVKKDDKGVNRLFLNNQAIFQYGPLDQGWWPDGLYTPASDAALKYDIEMTKKFGMNLARKHVKVEIDRWYYWCDKLGLLVWQDMPSSNVNNDNAEAKANFRRELGAIVDDLYNHPSIVMWVPFNEGWGQHDTPETTAWLEQRDPSRPINEASGWNDEGAGTITDMHRYPGPGMRPVEDKRVSVLGEFGGLGMPVRGHTWQAERNWGYVSYDTAEQLTDAYVNLLTAMRPLIGEGLSAAVYTQTSDVEIEVNGLMTYDRKLVKMDLDRIAAAARKLYGPPPSLKTLVATSEDEPQVWRYKTEAPGSRWFEPGFDDSSWATGPGGFGTEGTPGAHVGTEWNGETIWLRRKFNLTDLPAAGALFLRLHHDENVVVYLNGERITRQRGHTSAYELTVVNGNLAEMLKVGENVLAVRCEQTEGGQYIDVGLAVVSENESQQPVETTATAR